MSGEKELSDVQKLAVLNHLLDEERSMAIFEECGEFEEEEFWKDPEPWALAIENYIGQVRSTLRKLEEERSKT